jgi:hypothetical protein
VLSPGASGQVEKPSPCLDEGETIYSPGKAGVKDPKLQMERQSPDAPITVRYPIVLELIINSAGKICDIHVLKATDPETAKRLIEHVTDNFRFTPATRKGKPVAARFTVVFNPPGRQHP